MGEWETSDFSGIMALFIFFNGLLPAYKNPVSINNKIVSVPTTLYNMTFACQSARSVVKPSSLSYWLSPSLSVRCTFLALSSNSWSPCSGTAASTVLLFPSWNAGYIFLVEAEVFVTCQQQHLGSQIPYQVNTVEIQSKIQIFNAAIYVWRMLRIKSIFIHYLTINRFSKKLIVYVVCGSKFLTLKYFIATTKIQTICRSKVIKSPNTL